MGTLAPSKIEWNASLGYKLQSFYLADQGENTLHLGRWHLDVWRDDGHEDCGLDAEVLGGQGHPLGVVACGAISDRQECT